MCSVGGNGTAALGLWENRILVSVTIILPVNISRTYFQGKKNILISHCGGLLLALALITWTVQSFSITIGYQYDFVFDWTILNYQSKDDDRSESPQWAGGRARKEMIGSKHCEHKVPSIHKDQGPRNCVVYALLCLWFLF